MTMTDEYETGANYIIEALHIVLRNHDGELLESMLIQLYSCSKEKEIDFSFLFLNIYFIDSYSGRLSLEFFLYTTRM